MERVLRTHHLDLWQDFTNRFDREFKGKNPQEIPCIRLKKFVRKFALEQISGEKKFQKLSKTAHDSPDMDEEIKWLPYYDDLIGKNNFERRTVLARRIEIYADFLLAARENKDEKIILMAEPDAYCRACAVGNHCKEVVPAEKNNDLIYKNALMEVLQREEAKAYVEKEMFGITEKGEIFVTIELLFDWQFYSLLRWTINQKQTNSGESVL